MAMSLMDFVAAQRTRAGPLGDHLAGFAALLTEQGYAGFTAHEKVRWVADLGAWLGGQPRRAADLTEAMLAQFQRERPVARGRRRGHAATLRGLLAYLRAVGIVAPAPAVGDTSRIGQLHAAFAQYLTQERGLGAATRARYLAFTGPFLDERVRTTGASVAALRAEDVHRFLARHAHAASPGSARLMVTALRAFLRWLFLCGETATDLAVTVPAVADWGQATVPKALPPDDVERLLRHAARYAARPTAGRGTAGRRDLAILLLLARLGLRAGEVVALELEDIDWTAGTVTVRGKGGRQDRLPLPWEVGEALAAYLRAGRPRGATRRVFVRARAPRRGFKDHRAISTIVKRALARAGLEPPHKGAHQLRHALACTMLRRGADLGEIGEILRHRHPDTTARYAKVDLEALRALAPTWPAGAS